MKKMLLRIPENAQSQGDQPQQDTGATQIDLGMEALSEDSRNSEEDERNQLTINRMKIKTA